ncbi:aquaporin-like protein [Tothia fuscella]|uniref:Aquaporin-like protein n=1 Tax=Tothia fuscella TaxID=1048955 RepID=A0A9P4NWH6_9PEZI|nr:aquaporin-like protein [Tothia fuscella]
MTTRHKPDGRHHTELRHYPEYPRTSYDQQNVSHHSPTRTHHDQLPHRTHSRSSRESKRHVDEGYQPNHARPRVQPFNHEHQEKARDKGIKNHFVAASGEFIGTIMFLWFAFAAHLMVIDQNADEPLSRNGGISAQTVVFISLAYGFSLLVTAWGWFRISGGLFNPAVTLGLCLAGQLPWLRALFLVPSQLLGAMVAAALVSAMLPGNMSSINTTLSPRTSIVQGLFIEMFLTALLIFIVIMLAAEKSKATFIAPIGIGLALFVAELAGVNYTGGSLNPARSLGPAVAGGGFPGYHWIYWLGPLLGAVISAGYYRFVKFFNYEEANPGQDSSGGDFKDGGRYLIGSSIPRDPGID